MRPRCSPPLFSSRLDRGYLCALLAAVLLCAGSACTRRRGAGQAEDKSEADVFAPYSAGPWRLSQHQLSSVVLTVSHILIAHDRSKTGLESPIRMPGWEIDLPLQRTRDEARLLAGRIAREARAEPGAFAALAAQHSDDIVTRERGGSLGTRTADFLPVGFLDALNTMQPGDVSRVIETSAGYHVLALRPPPAREMVSAARILIGYRPSVENSTRPGRSIARSRSDALAMAREVSSQAVAAPGRFSELVEKYSDHVDARRHGDFGSWNTHDPKLWAIQVEQIARLRVGEVSPPIEGPNGFDVFLRTPHEPRASLALTYLEVARERPAKPGEDRAALLALLPEDVRAMLRNHGAGFEELQRKYCCARTIQWSSGSGVETYQQVAENLKLGEVRLDALQVNPLRIRIYKRAEPTPEAAKTAVSALPKSTKVDLDAYVAAASRGDQISNFINAVQVRMGPDLGLALQEPELGRITRTLETLKQQLRSVERDQRLEVLRAARAQLLATLGPERFDALQANFRSAVAHKLSGRSR